MRKPLFLSPSSLGMFESDRQEFYRKYLADNKPPKVPQTPPMSVGSAFDCYVKAALYLRAIGDGNPKYTFDALFERAVEPHNRDFAREAGLYIFDQYVGSGAFSALDVLIGESEKPPQFEFEIEGKIDGVPLLGKPDCRFFYKDGTHIVFDWKVNGFCSKSATSPCKYYSLVLDGWLPEVAKPSRNNGKPHPEWKPLQHSEQLVIGEQFMESVNTDWADQLSTYAWMLGEPVGDERVVMCVHQIVAKPTSGQPLLRVAQFENRVSATWQKTLISRYQACWRAVESGHIFDTLDRDASDELCTLLDNQTETLVRDDAFGRYVNEIVRA